MDHPVLMFMLEDVGNEQEWPKTIDVKHHVWFQKQKLSLALFQYRLNARKEVFQNTFSPVLCKSTTQKPPNCFR